jgi:hypothetical protein
MYWSVIKVKPLPNYELELTFEGDKVRIFDMKPYLDRGVFSALKDKTVFNRVKVAFSSIEWPDEIDLDPEILYEDSVPLDVPA